MNLQDLSAELGRRLDRGEATLPLLPAVATEVLSLVNNPESDAVQLARLIQNDQVLAGHVMKVANSPLLRGSSATVSLQQAITRMGLRFVGEIALAASLGPKLFKAPSYAALVDLIWRESLATALWSKEIARHLRRNVEVGFLCGLLHQIGKPVVLQAIQDIDGPEADARSEQDLASLLDGHGHTAGLQVAQAWRLPELVRETIVGLEDIAKAPAAAELVALISAARAFAIATLTSDPALQSPQDLAVMSELNLYRDDIEALLEHRDAVLSAVQEMAL